MTAKIQQNVTPRSRRGEAQVKKQWGQPRLWRGQRGTISQSTLTLVFAVLAIVSVMSLGFLYLQQVFGTAAHGSTIQALEQNMSDLKERQKELELNGAELRSIQSVEERVKELNLVSASNVGYLVPAPRRVARTTSL